MKAFVVDENVPIVANDAVRINSKLRPKAAQANHACRLKVLRALTFAVKSGLVVIDDAGTIIAKYRRHLSGKGQPGLGDAFLKHIADRQFDRRKVRRISLAIAQDGSFVAFPSAQHLRTFDPEDRIFVALALTARERPAILNAVDSDYSEHAAALRDAGVVVKELCPDCLA